MGNHVSRVASFFGAARPVRLPRECIVTAHRCCLCLKISEGIVDRCETAIDSELHPHIFCDDCTYVNADGVGLAHRSGLYCPRSPWLTHLFKLKDEHAKANEEAKEWYRRRPGPGFGMEYIKAVEREQRAWEAVQDFVKMLAMYCCHDVRGFQPVDRVVFDRSVIAFYEQLPSPF